MSQHIWKILNRLQVVTSSMLTRPKVSSMEAVTTFGYLRIVTSVAYVYSASREATILDDVLKGFTGVLVSDFYGGYDALSCPQQKCLIHLMRDINDDLLETSFQRGVGFYC